MSYLKTIKDLNQYSLSKLKVKLPKRNYHLLIKITLIIFILLTQNDKELILTMNDKKVNLIVNQTCIPVIAI